MNEKGKVLIVVAEDWSFLSHRIALARTLKKDGFEVVIACRVQNHRAQIEQEGFRLVALDLARESIAPITALKTIVMLAKLYRDEKPEAIVHSSLFLSLLGSLAGLMSGFRKNLNLITGLGFVFISQSLKARVIRFFVKGAFRVFASFKTITVVVQNKDDQAVFEKMGFRGSHNLNVVVGSGVDEKTFYPADQDPHPPQVTFVGRLLWSKGVAELIEAARILKKKGKLPKIVLVGEPDPGNPQSAALEDITRWSDENLAEFWGKRSDIAEIYRRSTIAVLPSWREGLPKSLLEAASSGLAMVATDVPGCRELVKDGVNGLLVPLKSPEKLAEAIETLMENPQMRQNFGRAGRKLIEERLNETAIARQTADLVKHLL